MAKVFSPPEGFTPPEHDYKVENITEHWKKEDAWIERLRQWVRDNYVPGKKHSTTSTVGKVIRSHHADGYACYMVASERPLHLVHLPIGDAWQKEAAWERGLSLKDVREMVKRDEGMAKLFGSSRGGKEAVGG